MTTTSLSSRPGVPGEPDAVAVRPAKRPALRRPKKRIGDRLLYGYTWLIILWLMAPIVIMILFSFNNTHGRVNTTWNGFTFRWYSWSEISRYNDLITAVVNSLKIVVFAVIGATLLGTLIGIALGRYRFRGQSVLNLVLFACISAPEIVMGASLLSLFTSAGVGLGLVTIIIAHIMFCLSFVAVIVRARVLTLDPSIEEAAKDLGATAFTTFRRVTLPMIWPAVVSGALLAFVLSIDDFVVTNFTAGGVTTFPLWIYGSAKLGMPPQVNVIGTLIFLVGLVIAAVNLVASRRSEGR